MIVNIYNNIVESKFPMKVLVDEVLENNVSDRFIIDDNEYVVVSKETTDYYDYSLILNIYEIRKYGR